MKALSLALGFLAAVIPAAMAQEKVVGGYFLIDPTMGPAKLQALAANAATLPVNRVILSFLRPDMVYVQGSNTLQYTGLGYYASAGANNDWGFAEIKQYVAQLQAGGVEVFISMGGWNYNCYPYFYAKYSIAFYGSGPNYWKITQYGGGSVAGCNESNMWCYVCEPQSQGTTLADFTIFPEPANSATWKSAQAYVAANPFAGYTPTWHPQLVGGAQFTDPRDGSTVVTVPGSNYWQTQNRDPYQDLVYLAKDLGLDGVDVDYEEMWHADTFETKLSSGSYDNSQTVYKYTAILKDVIINVQNIYPTLKVSTAAGAAGAWSGNWWGGNLKGVWLKSYQQYPDALKFLFSGANAGGLNVMTYDLSDNNQYYECPDTTSDCDLPGQVAFYMGTFDTAGMAAYVGYEIGTPAYPDPTEDPTHQIPLTQTALTTILQNTQPKHQGGFFWELFKPQGSSGNLDASTAAQQICKAVLGSGTARCSGVIPPVGSR
ncbi:uncharacterized protein BJ171DRAFT_565652 [Polychytrium aggregatum]|uniref:uncharacterized protein n=1 Tax=Polychytrium aggregatum TaxID=110093 RepID=UPI0022FF3802|nr:uncharacterized protein BJ171DRAFT_565652 [Polychytrium aggregatum]KAI9207906.1 hypothetical protein BJ171DRAFT_565652 [Polychytrium aggregatum]